jgi:outer membrane receptor protein involved in Fe transport
MSKFRLYGFWVLLLIITLSSAYAQTTGKILGKVTDARTGEPVLGANIVLEGTSQGAVADHKGEFFILNVPPGSYTLRLRMIGYESVRMENIQVSVNRTSNVQFKLNATMLQGEEVTVQAEKIVMKKDQTSSVRNVSSEQIDILPVENMGAIISMQAGVVNNHFRGGRYDEVAYLVDGVEVTEAFSSSGRAVDLEPESIQDLEVITGTFNAEYGDAMSGVVNAVTKDGTRDFHGSASSSFANYFTPHKDVFIGLRDQDLNRNQDYKVQLSGPVWHDKITFFANYRFQDNKNYLNGVRRFNVDDYSFFSADDPALWFSEHNGDSAYVAMDRDITWSALGKLTFKPFRNFKSSLLYSHNNDEWHNYDHAYKYDPDGMAASYRTTDMYSLQFNHMLTPRLFYELKLSYIDNYTGWYLYENPLDTRYVHDAYHDNSGPGFYTGGQDKGHSVRTTKDASAKFDLTWQASKYHALKAGVVFTRHDIDNRYSDIRNFYMGTELEGIVTMDSLTGKINYPFYAPVIYPDSSVYSDIYRVKPIEFAGYIQDKMEFDEMVINFGLRYDYFDPKTVYPSQLRNPANQLDFRQTPDKMSTYPAAKAKVQLSPRFGLSYKLGNAALLHFSYGHFFQMPPMYAMYGNHSFQISPTDYSTTIGNSQLDAQKTVQYEIGLWQELMKGMGLEVALFYRDIYDLLSTKIISTFNQIEYGLYSNKDYGNAKGLEIKYDFVNGPLSAFLNYTLQYTRGNADYPTQTFDRAGNSMDPVNRFIPMSWDQRHTLNLTGGYNTARYGLTATAYYNSGSPYTWSPIAENPLSRLNLYPNNSWRPARFSVDLSGYYDITVIKNIKARLTLNVYNLFDTLNEEWVNAQTGRAYTAIVRAADLANHRSNFNTYEDTYHNPSMYAAPRMVKLGMGVTF